MRNNDIASGSAAPNKSNGKLSGSDMVLAVLSDALTSMTIHEIAEGVRIPPTTTNGIVERLIVRKLVRKTGVNASGRIVFSLNKKITGRSQAISILLNLEKQLTCQNASVDLCYTK